jgi:purine nucleoside phosphorylase
MKSADSTLAEGVYVHWRGPTYETPAEIAMMRTMGADLSRNVHCAGGNCSSCTRR